MRRPRPYCATAAVTVMAAGLATAPASAGGADTVVRCSTSALATAIVEAHANATLRLAHGCTYRLRSSYQDGDGLPPITKRLVIRGRGASIVREPASTDRFRVFDVGANGDLRLDGVTIKGGQSPANADGGGIRVRPGGSLSLRNVSVIGNSAAYGGGVDVAPGATAIIANSRLSDNNADYTGGGLQSDGTVRVEGSRIIHNHAGDYGGGVDHESGRAVFEHTFLLGNSSGANGTGDGGGIDIDGGAVKFDHSYIVGNSTVGSSGGGIWNGATLVLHRTQVAGNVAAAPDAEGAGIYNADTLKLDQTVVYGNKAPGSNSQGAGLYNEQNGDVTLDRTAIEYNTSTVAPGGVSTSDQFSVRKSVITHNFPSNCTGSAVRVTGCTD